jgi:hypothetical protein
MIVSDKYEAVEFKKALAVLEVQCKDFLNEGRVVGGTSGFYVKLMRKG